MVTLKRIIIVAVLFSVILIAGFLIAFSWMTGLPGSYDNQTENRCNREINQQINTSLFQHKYQSYFDKHDAINAHLFKQSRRQKITNLLDDQNIDSRPNVDARYGSLNGVDYLFYIKHNRYRTEFEIVNLSKE